MKVEWVNGGVFITVVYRCGHTTKLFFRDESYGRSIARDKTNELCPRCTADR